MKQPYLSNSNMSINLFGNGPPPLCGGGSPLGFITPSQAHTTKIPELQVNQEWIDKIESVSGFYNPVEKLFAQKRYDAIRSDRILTKKFCLDNPAQFPRIRKTQGLMVNRFKTGEMTGGFFTTGLETKIMPDIRYGTRFTTSFTRKSQVKMRRAVDHSITDRTFLKYFSTLTFAPGVMKPWQFNDDGTVRHDYAKHKLKNFLKALGMKKKRLGKILDYIWAAELQKNGNIHFHIMWNEFFDIKYLSKLWGQAKNSVDIRTTNNPEHSIRYMMKYITSDEKSEIQGNRYYITNNLREQMKPIKEILIQSDTYDAEHKQIVTEARDFLKSVKSDIESRGGRLLDFGFSFPMPKSNKPYYDKKQGKWVKPNNCQPKLAKQIYSYLRETTDIKPF